ncbi:hypothetical protein OH77DRAFT_1377259, partial [Trametes cingulata]
PFYNPYPYPPQWKLGRKADKREIWFWHHRQDEWRSDVEGYPLQHMTNRVFQFALMRIKQKQAEAKKKWEDEQLARPPPPTPGQLDTGTYIEFATVDGKRGVPVKLLLLSRKAIERGIQDPKGRCFENWHRDTEWVRIQWPAYPDHVPARSILVSQRKATTYRPRRPVTRLELAVSLAGVITQFYSDVTRLEPDPAFAHLALGPAEGRISLYGLRMIGIRAAPDGFFDMTLEVDQVDET